jgi:serine protease Do
VLAFVLLQGAPGDSAAHAEPDDGIELRRELQERFRAAAARLRPSLVRIETVGGVQPSGASSQAPPQDKDEGEDAPAPPRTQNPFRDSPGSHFVIADGPTTGIVYSRDGYILTSGFNFVREPAFISVTLSDGRRLVADLVARDQVRKIALLKVDATDLPVPGWAELDDVRIGQWAVALGLGFGGDEASITVGIVSALGRMRGNAIQTDAKLNPANYGGPLCDLSGRIIGICVPMAQRPGELAGVELYDAGVGFAIPKERVDNIAEALRTGRSFYRGWLGIVVDPTVPDAVVIRNIADPSPLLDAGVLPGDRIIRAEGRDIVHYGNLVQATYMVPAGERVHLEIGRDESSFEVVVELARGSDLGPLPELSEPFDPSSPLPEDSLEDEQ